MSTGARKARKRSGEPVAAKPVKVGTPVEERLMFVGNVIGLPGTKYQGRFVARSGRKLRDAIEARTGGDAA